VSEQPIRAGLVGTGFGYRTLLPALMAEPRVHVEVVCSKHIERARMVAEANDIPRAVDDFEAVLGEDLDLVCVCTPPFLHAEMTMAALERGRHVFSTKPLAMDIGSAGAVRDVARAKGVVHSMDLSHRYFPVRRHLRNLVRDGYLGDLRYVVALIFDENATAERAHLRFWNWVSDSRQGGGILRTSLMNHHIDLVRYTFGEIRDVHCVPRTLITEKPVLPPGHHEDDGVDAETPSVGMAPVDTEDAIAMTGTLGANAQFMLAGTWSVYHGSGVRVEAYGSEGTLILEPSGRLYGARRQDRALEELPVPEAFRPPDVGPERIPLFTLMVGEIVDSIRGTAVDPLFATFDDGYRLCEITHDVLGPVRTGAG
jgi:predicted dehydrogenase